MNESTNSFPRGGLGPFFRFNFVVYYFFAKSVAVDTQNVGGPGLVSVGFFKNHFDQRLFDPSHYQLMQISSRHIVVHMGYILFQSLFKPVFEERSGFAVNFIHS